MYFNCNGSAKIVKQDVIDNYLNEKRKGNVIYCLKYNDNYFAVNKTYRTTDELNNDVAKYILEGYEVYYHANDKADNARGNKGKCQRTVQECNMEK